MKNNDLLDTMREICGAQKTAKHTPGPWALQSLETHHNGYDWPTFAVRACPTNYCLAVVGDVDRATAEQNAANARLIAAAPDLLAALKRALVAVEYYHAREGATYLAQDCLAAIAKAEGRA